jgi:hypothetical protein
MSEIICDECGAVIAFVVTGSLEQILLEMAGATPDSIECAETPSDAAAHKTVATPADRPHRLIEPRP